MIVHHVITIIFQDKQQGQAIGTVEKCFQFVEDGKGVKDAKQQRALLLHSTGMDVQEIFATLTDPGPRSPSFGTDSANVYEKAIRTLDS